LKSGKRDQVTEDLLRRGIIVTVASPSIMRNEKLRKKTGRDSEKTEESAV
jgi:hypothetical protein